ncbi:hypothetical protein [Streptomyces hydrogenans]|uniref:hypothetical protein n=1 Tax=Streptomyces hydrogenans TaxID=1873719 RepID=UPI00380F02D2
MTTEDDGGFPEIRRLDQIPPAVPLGWLVDQEAEYSLRLYANEFADYPHGIEERGTVGDALALLAIQEAMVRNILHGRGGWIWETVRLGASWREVGAALGIEPDDARSILREWSERRTEEGTGALIAMGDDERAAVT